MGVSLALLASHKATLLLALIPEEQHLGRAQSFRGVRPAFPPLLSVLLVKIVQEPATSKSSRDTRVGSRCESRMKLQYLPG